MKRVFRSLACFSILAAIVLRASAQPSPSPTFAAAAPPSLQAEKLTLPNGLEVILHQDKKTPIVSVNVYYHVGSKDELPGRNGFAHLFEHVMFQGSKHVPEDKFFQILEKAGATDVNGTTNDDRTNYFETVPSNRLELALWLESDRMGFLLDHADQATFESQREVVKNERRQNYENAPYGLVWQGIREHLFPKDHPYHRQTIGTPADLDAAKLDDVRAFFRTWYVPNNASLVIAGDFERDAALALVQKYFGPIPKGAAVAPMRAKVPKAELAASKTLTFHARVELPRLVYAWQTPAFFAPGDADLDLVSHVLAAGKTSRLYKKLVYELQVAQDVSVSQSSMELGSIFSVTVTLRPGKTLDAAMAVVDQELERFRQEGPTDDELSRAKTSVVSDSIFGLEKVSGRGNHLNTYNHYTQTPNYFARDRMRTESATVLSVKEAAARYLAPTRRIVTRVEPDSAAPVAGRLDAVTGGAP
jgi:zinc protease